FSFRFLVAADRLSMRQGVPQPQTDGRDLPALQTGSPRLSPQVLPGHEHGLPPGGSCLRSGRVQMLDPEYRSIVRRPEPVLEPVRLLNEPPIRRDGSPAR